MTVLDPTDDYQSATTLRVQRPVLPLSLSILALGLGIGALLFGGLQSGQLPSINNVIGWLESWRMSPLAVPMIMAGFVVLSFATVPQFVLISMCVVTFGPLVGLGIAWSATMISAWLGFMAGPLFGRAVARRWPNAMLDRMMDFVARNSFLSALFIRFLPTGPFVLVNLTLGAAHGRVMPFLWGTGIGILPKAVLIAMTGAGLSQAANGRYQMMMVVLAITALIWLVLAIFGKRMVLRLIKQSQIASSSLEIKRAASQKG
ncbi:MAG: VTT domain-containing protein [Robiginitomaculum sp.]|nr:VTT domain-containing protein [Robiginitomaculum sp.]MDQ7077935.1 VTT domain-containing protein [Robiginitomaculum sp.]